MTLQPGQSVSQTATWDGTITETAYQQGTNTNDAVNQFGTFQVSNPNAPQEDTATFQITDPLQGALTTNQTTYQIGPTGPAHLHRDEHLRARRSRS